MTDSKNTQTKAEQETKKSNRGRKKWVPDEEIARKAFDFASLGLTEEQIAHNLGISYQTLNERKNEFNDFAEAIKNGKSHGIAMVANKLYESAMAGNLGAQIFYLKARASWKETNVNEVTGNDGKAIEINQKTNLAIEEIQSRIRDLIK